MGNGQESTNAFEALSQSLIENTSTTMTPSEMLVNAVFGEAYQQRLPSQSDNPKVEIVSKESQDQRSGTGSKPVEPIASKREPVVSTSRSSNGELVWKIYANNNDAMKGNEALRVSFQYKQTGTKLLETRNYFSRNLDKPQVTVEMSVDSTTRERACTIKTNRGQQTILLDQDGRPESIEVSVNGGKHSASLRYKAGTPISVKINGNEINNPAQRREFINIAQFCVDRFRQCHNIRPTAPIDSGTDPLRLDSKEILPAQLERLLRRTEETEPPDSKSNRYNALRDLMKDKPEIAMSLSASHSVCDILDSREPKRCANSLEVLLRLRESKCPRASEIVDMLEVSMGKDKVAKLPSALRTGGDEGKKALEDLKLALPREEQRLANLRTRMITQELDASATAEQIGRAIRRLEAKSLQGNKSATEQLQRNQVHLLLKNADKIPPNDLSMKLLLQLSKLSKAGNKYATDAITSLVVPDSQRKTFRKLETVSDLSFLDAAKVFSRLTETQKAEARADAARELIGITGKSGLSRTQVSALGLALAHAADCDKALVDRYRKEHGDERVPSDLDKVAAHRLLLEQRYPHRSLRAHVQEAFNNIINDNNSSIEFRAQKTEILLNGLYAALRNIDQRGFGTRVLSARYLDCAASRNNLFIPDFRDKGLGTVGDIGTSFGKQFEEIRAWARTGDREALFLMAGFAAGKGRYNQSMRANPKEWGTFDSEQPYKNRTARIAYHDLSDMAKRIQSLRAPITKVMQKWNLRTPWVPDA